MTTRTDKTSSTPVAHAQQQKETPFFQKPGSDGFFAKAAPPPPFIQKQADPQQNKTKKNEYPEKRSLQEQMPEQSIEYLKSIGIQKQLAEWSDNSNIVQQIARQLASDFVKNRKPISVGVPNNNMLATPYGSDKLVPPRLIPSEDRVYHAIITRLNFDYVAANKKIDDWSFQWYKPMRKKNANDIVTDIANWATDEFLDLPGELLNATVDYSVETMEKKGNKIMAKFIGDADAILGRASTVIGLIELIKGFGDPVEVELNPFQKETDLIVADVKAFIRQREVASEKKYQEKKLPVQVPDALSVKQPYTDVPTSFPNKYQKLVVGK